MHETAMNDPDAQAMLESVCKRSLPIPKLLFSYTLNPEAPNRHLFAVQITAFPQKASIERIAASLNATACDVRAWFSARRNTCGANIRAQAADLFPRTWTPRLCAEGNARDLRGKVEVFTSLEHPFHGEPQGSHSTS